MVQGGRWKKYRGKRDKLCFAYVKTYNEPVNILRKVQKEGFRTIGRDDILAVLDGCDALHPLVMDFREHLQRMTNRVNKYKERPVDDWKGSEWQGFYTELVPRISHSCWGNVPRKSGGFWAFWWHGVNVGDVKIYLQMERKILCFKICVQGETRRSELRNSLSKRIRTLAKENGLKIHRPKRA